MLCTSFLDSWTCRTDLTWPQVNHGLTSQTQANFGSKVQHLSSKMTASLHVLLVIQNLRYPSHTGKRHRSVKSWTRPCGHLWNVEERFNLQIPCQQVDLTVGPVAGHVFFRCRIFHACKKAGAPLKLKDQIEASYCLELGLKRQDCIISLFDESPRSLLFFIPFPCEFFGPKF